MLNFNINGTNQILNNFKKNSKLYIPLSELKTEKISLFYFNYQSQNPILSFNELNPPYFYLNTEKLLAMLFSIPGLRSIFLKQKDGDIEIDKKMISNIIGFLSSLRERNISFIKAFNSGNFHLAHYLSTIENIDSVSIVSTYIELGFLDEAVEIAQKIDNEKKYILLSRIYRKKGELKKSLIELSKITSGEYEIERNLEYGWLHLLTGKYENAYKIFKYYSSTPGDFEMEANLGLAASISFSAGYEKIKEAIESLNKIITHQDFRKIDALKILSEIYIAMKDYIKAVEVIKNLEELNSLTTDLLYNKVICELSLSDYDNATLDIIRLGVFDHKRAVDILNSISRDKLKEIYPPEIVVEKIDEKKKGLFEAVLAPEDISKTSSISKSEIKEKIEFVNSIQVAGNENDKDEDEISRLAFEFSRMLEEEFHKKVYFNYEGIEDIERKLRITHISEISLNEKNEIGKYSSAFVMFLLRERFKAKIISYPSMEIWYWPAIIKNKYGMELITYPAARIYNFISSPVLLPGGWLKGYVLYISDFLNKNQEIPIGKEAVLKKAKSDENRIFDATIEHKKILVVSKDLPETSYIPHNSSGLIKLESEIKKRFKPRIPLTTGGWKILRCYAHIFLEMVIKDFNPQWYNVERNDGLWAFQISQNTFIFPVGKVYKAVLVGESLLEYWQELEKFKKKI